MRETRKFIRAAKLSSKLSKHDYPEFSSLIPQTRIQCAQAKYAGNLAQKKFQNNHEKPGNELFFYSCGFEASPTHYGFSTVPIVS